LPSGRTVEELRRLTTRARYPRSSSYDPVWMLESIMGPNVLWCTESLCNRIPLEPGMRVLDLGCGKAVSSVFLAKELGVQVFAADLMVQPAENLHRIREAGLEHQVFPMRLDARSLPFPPEYFDAVLSIGAYMYFGTDDTYLRLLQPLLKPGGRIGITVHGLTEELEEPPDDLPPLWRLSFETFHTADWWRRHWKRSGLLEVEHVTLIEDGWREWADWYELGVQEQRPMIRPEDLEFLRADAGRRFGLVEAVARRPA
jgi:cyclopropane fatty-acyl-phospholipid synthase-like methyltransferase